MMFGLSLVRGLSRYVLFVEMFSDVARWTNTASKAVPFGAGRPWVTDIAPCSPWRYGTSTQTIRTIPTSAIPPSPATGIQSGKRLRLFSSFSILLGRGGDGVCAGEPSVGG